MYVNIVNVMLSNTVDKLQFLPFICAVLLSITVHFIALRLRRVIMCWNRCKCSWDIDFRDGNLPPCWVFKRQNFYLNRKSGGLRHVTMLNFIEIGPSIAEILLNFWFIKMAVAAILNIWIREILLADGSRGPRRAIVPNFAKIGQSIAEIQQFFDVSR